MYMKQLLFEKFAPVLMLHVVSMFFNVTLVGPFMQMMKPLSAINKNEL